MRAGILDRRVTVYKRTVGTNAQHEPIETFTSDGDVWGEVVDLRGRDFFAARAVNNEVTTRFRIRWRTDLTTKDRLGYGGRLFDIVQMSELGRKFGLEILAAARAS